MEIISKICSEFINSPEVIFLTTFTTFKILFLISGQLWIPWVWNRKDKPSQIYFRKSDDCLKTNVQKGNPHHDGSYSSD
jgi:hypothetical protein